MPEKVDIYAKKNFRIRATGKLHARIGPQIVLEVEPGVRRIFVAPGLQRRVPDPENPGKTKLSAVEPIREHVIEANLVVAGQLRADGYEVEEISAEEAAAAAPKPLELPSPGEAVAAASTKGQKK